MINWFDLAAFAIALASIASLVVANVFLLVKLKQNTATAAQLAADKIVLLLQLEKMAETTNTKSLEETQGFIKFLSDSRDWAFQYIEDVQTALKEYDEALNSNNAKRINDSYKKLIDMLPEDDVVK